MLRGAPPFSELASPNSFVNSRSVRWPCQFEVGSLAVVNEVLRLGPVIILIRRQVFIVRFPLPFLGGASQ